MSKPTNFRFDERTSDLLEHLKEASGSASKAEVVRKALQLLNVAQAAHNRGEHLILRSEGETPKEREVVLW